MGTYFAAAAYQASENPTKPFTSLEPHSPCLHVSKLRKSSRSTNSESLKPSSIRSTGGGRVGLLRAQQDRCKKKQKVFVLVLGNLHHLKFIFRLTMLLQNPAMKRSPICKGWTKKSPQVFLHHVEAVRFFCTKLNTEKKGRHQLVRQVPSLLICYRVQ